MILLIKQCSDIIILNFVDWWLECCTHMLWFGDDLSVSLTSSCAESMVVIVVVWETVDPRWCTTGRWLGCGDATLRRTDVALVHLWLVLIVESCYRKNNLALNPFGFLFNQWFPLHMLLSTNANCHKLPNILLSGSKISS